MFLMSSETHVGTTLEPLENESIISLLYTLAPWLTIVPLMTNWSYNQNFLKKISIQTTIKMSLKFHVDLHLNCTYSVDYHNTCYWDNVCSYNFTTERLRIWIPLNLLNGVYSTSFHIFSYNWAYRTYTVHKLGGGVHVCEGNWMNGN